MRLEELLHRTPDPQALEAAVARIKGMKPLRRYTFYVEDDPPAVLQILLFARSLREARALLLEVRGGTAALTSADLELDEFPELLTRAFADVEACVHERGCLRWSLYVDVLGSPEALTGGHLQ